MLRKTAMGMSLLLRVLPLVCYCCRTAEMFGFGFILWLMRFCCYMNCSLKTKSNISKRVSQKKLTCDKNISPPKDSMSYCYYKMECA